MKQLVEGFVNFGPDGRRCFTIFSKEVAGRCQWKIFARFNPFTGPNVGHGPSPCQRQDKPPAQEIHRMIFKHAWQH
ncbi:MAG: hypothetical protein U1F65_00020 [Verrucomicrobiota bacterium]